jgi:hypothetical protein
MDGETYDESFSLAQNPTTTTESEQEISLIYSISVAEHVN